MSDDINKLIQRLRATFFGERDFSLHDVRDAADALERLVAERDRLKAEVERLRGEQRLKSLIGPSENAVERIIAERDRLKAALDKAGQFIADEYADPRVEPDGEWLAREARPIYAAICEALEGREWERLPNEKVAGVAALEAAGAGLSPASGQAPATDPAPAVCEWTRTPWGRAPSASPGDALYTPRCDADYLCNVPGSGMCHRCGLPIKFMEAKG